MNLKSQLIALTLAILCLSACKKNSENILKNNTIDSHTLNYDTLSVQVAKNYVKNYAKNVGIVDSVFIQDGNSKIKKLSNTRAVWFSAVKMKALIKKLEAEGGDGIRFYFATYDSTYAKNQKNNPSKDYWDHNTLIMVSTKDSIGIYHRDYYNNKNVGSKSKKGFITLTFPENRGEMCPPPANCRDIGATLLFEKSDTLMSTARRDIR